MRVFNFKNIMSAIISLLAWAGCSNDLFSQNSSLNDWANFQKYVAENSTLPKVTPGEQRVVFMGNSITEFWKSTDSAFFAGRQYIDRGISGQTTPQMLLRFRKDVIELHPSVVVILAGINDIAENTGPIKLEDVFGNIISMVELAVANDIEVVLCAVLPSSDFYWNPGLKPADKVIALNEMLREYSWTNGIVYSDYYSPMVNEVKGLKSAYSDDGVHPNLAGYRVMEPIVESAIKEALKHRASRK